MVCSVAVIICTEQILLTKKLGFGTPVLLERLFASMLLEWMWEQQQGVLSLWPCCKCSNCFPMCKVLQRRLKYTSTFSYTFIAYCIVKCRNNVTLQSIINFVSELWFLSYSRSLFTTCLVLLVFQLGTVHLTGLMFV